jgi:hypothetical protein
VRDTGAISDEEFAEVIQESFPSAWDICRFIADKFQGPGSVTMMLPQEMCREDLIQAFAITPIRLQLNSRYRGVFYLLNEDEVIGIPMPDGRPTVMDPDPRAPWRSMEATPDLISQVCRYRPYAYRFIRDLCGQMMGEERDYIEERVPRKMTELRRQLLELLAYDPLRWAMERGLGVQFGFLYPDHIVVRQRDRSIPTLVTTLCSPAAQILHYDRSPPPLSGRD